MGQQTIGAAALEYGIGQRLARFRIMSGVSPEEVWREYGIPPRLLELYEAGSYPVPPLHLATFAAAFGTTVAELRDADDMAMPPGFPASAGRRAEWGA